MKNILDGSKLVLGTCYYPEHWPREMWQPDLKRMKETGIEVIRIAEFAWNLTEPSEDVFVYDFWDEFLDLCETEGMKVIFCTPSATPPAWLTEKYPEVLNARKDGVLIRHGERRHYNYNSPVYQEKTRQIVTKLADHYAKRACIIGWQIDNEVNCETDVFYSESDDKAFRKWVQEKYETLENLNAAWGTMFWNQTYSAFSEVHVPRVTNQNSTNPHECLDYRRFVSDSARNFVKLQSDIIRRYQKEGDFITTNGMFNLDNHAMNKESLNFYMYDSYPNFAYDENYEKRGEGNLFDRWWSMNLTEVRSVSEPFGIMEQQSGAGGWTTRMMMPTPRPGQIRLWTMQSIAHGAEYVSFFRWRTSTIGTEIYWHGILDYSGRENRRIKEIRQIHEDLGKLRDVAGSYYVAKVAVVRTWDNQWDAQIDNWHGQLENVSQGGIFAAATRSHTPVDFVYLTENTNAEELEKYDALIFPHAVVTSEKEAEILSSYVANGGKLLLGCRAGLKKKNGQVTMEDLPGVFQKLAGCIVTEFTNAAPDEGAVHVIPKGENGRKFRISAQIFHDQLEATDDSAQVLGVYDSTYYKDMPALIRHPYGKGMVWSYGSTFSEDTARMLLDAMGVSTSFDDYIEIPRECELAARSDGGRTWLFVLNYDRSGAKLVLRREMTDVLQEGRVSGSYLLPAYGVAVFEL